MFSILAVLLVAQPSQDAASLRPYPILDPRRAKYVEEVPAGPWVPSRRTASISAGDACQREVVRGGYRSVQVNVDALGYNIWGDAANEPSIAIDPTNPRNIVIGWRQFDTVESNFRQAGFAYSHDAGHTWVFPGVLAPGVFRSDPILAGGPDGRVYYFGYTNGVPTIYLSFDRGQSWAEGPVLAQEDKPWMAVDLSDGIGRGNVYISGNFRGLWRSTDGGTTFDLYSASVGGILTMSVGYDGVLYVADTTGRAFKSTNAQDPAQRPEFTFLGGVHLGAGAGQPADPNPGGLSGQVWVATDHSNSPTRGYVYLLASEIAGQALDVNFVRSTDGGVTWSDPIRVNDDPLDNHAYQWFAMMSVAPNGRIDAVWNDTRNSGQPNLSELYYSYSIDAGDTWSPNIPVSPMFDSWIGWPNQNKIGDYYHMISDNLGVNVAYAATFNGEQDVYFLRIGPWDCNGNQVPDEEDIASGTSSDCNANGVPDECEYRADLDGDGLTTLADYAAFAAAMTGPSGSYRRKISPSPRPSPVRERGNPVASARGSDCGGSALLDIDHDGDIDLSDFAAFQRILNTP